MKHPLFPAASLTIHNPAPNLHSPLPIPRRRSSNQPVRLRISPSPPSGSPASHLRFSDKSRTERCNGRPLFGLGVLSRQPLFSTFEYFGVGPWLRGPVFYSPWDLRTYMLLVTLIERLTRCGGSHSTQPAPCADWISGIKCIPAHPLAKASFANHWRTFLEILLAVFLSRLSWL